MRQFILLYSNETIWKTFPSLLAIPLLHSSVKLPCVLYVARIRHATLISQLRPDLNSEK